MSEPSRNPMQLNIRISIRNFMGPEVFLLEENMELNTEEFMECAKILGQFHDIAKRVKEEKGFKP